MTDEKDRYHKIYERELGKKQKIKAGKRRKDELVGKNQKG